MPYFVSNFITIKVSGTWYNFTGNIIRTTTVILNKS